MDSPQGQVIEIVASGSDERLAVVEVDAPITCARCAAGKGCGAGLFPSGRTRRVEAKLPESLRIASGDTVAIDLDNRALLPAALIVYGWPLAGTVTGALLASLGPWGGDAVAATGALGGFAVAALLASRRLKSRLCVSRFRPVVVGRIDVGA